jgi:hypothetical protein
VPGCQGQGDVPLFVGDLADAQVALQPGGHPQQSHQPVAEQPAAQVLADEVDHQQLGDQEREWHQGIEQPGQPHVAEHGHQVLVPDVHTDQEGGHYDQPLGRAVAGVAALDLGDQRVQDQDLDQSSDGQIRGGELLAEPAGDPLRAWGRFHGGRSGEGTDRSWP